MISLNTQLRDVTSVGIAGHIRPDGDCVGACLALGMYIRKYYPQIRTDVYLGDFQDSFYFLNESDRVLHECEKDMVYDLFFSIDCSDLERLGDAQKYFEAAKKTICIDHHISNQGYADVNEIEPEASSASELICCILEEERITKEMAEALYLGMAHDSGVFHYSCTSGRTMRKAAMLMEKGIDFTGIVDETFYKKSYIQHQILGRALLESILMLDGKVIFSVVRQKDMKFFGVEAKDLDGIVSHLRDTHGVETAIFLYETAIQEYKVSMRSGDRVDVSRIASYFGGGGHKKAAGCSMQGSVYDVVNNLVAHIHRQLEEEQVKE